MRSLILVLSVITLSVIATGCAPESRKYRFERHFSENERDTLLVDMVTLIGRRPEFTDHLSRLQPQHRRFYIQQAEQFTIEYFYTKGDTSHFYLIRPARSPRGNTRGVGGKMTLNADRTIDYFEETFNTPVHPPDKLKTIGWELFQELIAIGNVEAYSGNREWIQWPDGRLKYDTEKREWRYDVVAH